MCKENQLKVAKYTVNNTGENNALFWEKCIGQKSDKKVPNECMNCFLSTHSQCVGSGSLSSTMLV